MLYAYDLHIHTALSPCGDNDMTPNNIVNMAIIKNLDIIAVTDHNSCENAKSVMEVAENTGLTVIPGMEVESSEEVHMICLFPSINKALEMQEIVYKNLPNLKNRVDIFGNQLIYNSEDKVIDENERMLITATSLSIDKILDLSYNFDGIAYPAHIDRNSYSIISNLGLIPKDLNIKAVEFSKYVVPKDMVFEYKYLERYMSIQSSDAHYLEDIMERLNFIELPDKTINTIIKKLKAGGL